MALDTREEIDTIRRIIVRSFDGINIMFFIEFITVANDLVQAILVKDSKGGILVDKDTTGATTRSSGAVLANQQNLPGYPVG